MSSVDCMPQGLIDRAGLTDCPTATKLLVAIGVYNFAGAVLSLVIGHDAVRKRIPSFSSGHQWRAWSGMLNAVIHVAAMAGATISLRANNFHPNTFMLFGFWAMRPRFALATPMWHMFSKCFSTHYKNPYLWSFKDTVVCETLLNVFALPFALWYTENRPSTPSPDAEISYICENDTAYNYFWNCFYVLAGAGGVSCILLGCMVLHFCMNRKSATYQPLRKGSKVIVNGPEESARKVGEQEIGRFWGIVLTVAALNMLVTFAAQWVIWYTFITDAVPDFCPGSLLGQGISLGVAIVVNSFLRPIIGGSSYS